VPAVPGARSRSTLILLNAAPPPAKFGRVRKGLPYLPNGLGPSFVFTERAVCPRIDIVAAIQRHLPRPET